MTLPTPPNPVDGLRALCGGPRDGALLRMSLANALLGQDKRELALVELRRALQFDQGYSAAWKMLGKTLTETGDTGAAIDAYQRGIAAARERGDKQAEKEMTVFVRRLKKSARGQ